MPWTSWSARIGNLLRKNKRPIRWSNCPSDNMAIPLVGEIPASTGPDLELFWCYCCGAGAAYFKNQQRGSPEAFRFFWDERHRSWRLRDVARLPDERSAIQFLHQLAPNGDMPDWRDHNN